MALSPELRRLMGLSSAAAMPPAMFAAHPKVQSRAALQVAPSRAVREGLTEARALQKRLEERSIVLYPDAEKMHVALERAHKTVQRAMATVQSNRSRYVGGQMNEKARSDLYRADQELAGALESIHAAMSAIEDLERNSKSSMREVRRRKR